MSHSSGRNQRFYGRPAGCRRQSRSQLADLGHLVGGEDRERLRTGGCDLLPQSRLTFPIAGDRLVLADRSHEFPDPGTEARGELGAAYLGLLEDVVKQAGGDDMIRRTGAVEQPTDLKRVLYERGVVGTTPLASVLSLCVLERGLSLWEAPHPLRQGP